MRESQVSALKLFVRTSTTRTFAELQTAFGKSFLLSVYADYLFDENPGNRVIIAVPNSVLKRVIEINCRNLSSIPLDINDGMKGGIFVCTHEHLNSLTSDSIK